MGKCQLELQVYKEKEGVLKDNDLHTALVLERERAEKLVARLQADAEQLCKWKIMDYSLLIGVNDRE